MAILFGCGTHAGKFLPERSLARELNLGVICIHEGAWPDLDLTADGICKNGAVNVLTKISPARGWGMAVRVIRRWHGWKKYNGPELTLTAFEPPASS